jgi:CheY-like chemotaxis protein
MKDEPPAPRLLIVDDEAPIRSLLRRLLLTQGFAVDAVAEADSAEHAIEALKGQHFDLVITDFKMGAMTGVELLAWVRREKPRVGCLLMTGFNDLESVEVVEVEGLAGVPAFGVVKKPWDNHDLMEKVRAALGPLPGRAGS